MKRAMIAALVIGLLGGCNMPKHSKHRAEAYERWSNARARVVTSLAEEYHKTGDLEKARESAAEAVNLDETYIPAIVLLSKVLIEQGHYDKAIEELRIGEVLQKNNPQMAYLLGVALEKRGAHTEAMKHYRKARALDPTNDAYVTASAEVLVAMGQPARALELIQAQLDRRDCSAGVHALAGEVAMMVGMHKKAAWHFQDCLDLEPAAAVAREGLARAHYFAGHYPEAVEALGALAEDEDHKDTSSWVYIMLGDCHLALNRPRQARTALQTATRIAPKTAKIWNALAKAALAVGDIPGAMSAAHKAVTLGGESLETAVVMAYGLMRQGRPLEAIKILDAAAQQHGEDPMVLCMLGRCYDALGRIEQANSCYRKALQNDPKHPLAKSLLSMGDLRDKGIR